jgi:hypothetical protein
MNDTDLWIKNEQEHNQITEKLDSLSDKLQNLKDLANITPMLIRWIVFPLVSILGIAFGAKEVITAIGTKVLAGG